MDLPNEGFIKLSRSFFNHHLWREERTYSLAEAWLDLIQMARFDVTPQSMVIKMKKITIHRGELRASQRYLAQRWNWSVGKVNRFLKMLEDERSVERRNEHSETIIKLCKYELYNPTTNEYLNTEMNANETLAEHRQIQIKESKESKEKKDSVCVSSPHGDTPAKSFKSLTLKEFYNSLKPFVNQYGKEMVRDFYDYWTEPNSKGTPKFQLERTWDTERRLRLWEKNEEKFYKGNGKQIANNDPPKRKRNEL